MAVFSRSMFALLLAITFIVGPSTAQCEEANKAKEYFARGETAYNLGQYRAAIEAYESAYKQVPDTALLFNIAQAYRLEFSVSGKRDDLVKSIATYKSFVRRSVTDSDHRRVAATFVTELEGTLAKFDAQESEKGILVLTGEGAVGAEVRIEGEFVGTIPLRYETKPGSVLVNVSRPGSLTWSQLIKVPPSTEILVPVILIDEAIIDRQRNDTWLITALVTGGVALFAEGLAIGFTFKAQDSFEGTDEADTAKTIAITGHVTAGVLALVSGIATYLYFDSGTPVKSHDVALVPSLRGGSFTLSF